MKKNGFTLIELMVTISLIVLIGIVAVVNVRNLINDSKQKAYATLVKTIEDSAKSYTYLNTSSINTLITANGYAEVTILELQQSDLLDTTLTNPVNNQEIDTSDKVRITKSNNLYNFEYIGG